LGTEEENWGKHLTQIDLENCHYKRGGMYLSVLMNGVLVDRLWAGAVECSIPMLSDAELHPR